MIPTHPSRRTTADGLPARPLSRLAPLPVGPRPVPRSADRTRHRPSPLAAPTDRPAGPVALPDAVVPPAGAGRGAIRPDPQGDARPRRLGGAPPPGPAVPRQASPAVLAGHAQLPGVRRVRGGGAARPRTRHSRDDPGRLPARPP